MAHTSAAATASEQFDMDRNATSLLTYFKEAIDFEFRLADSLAVGRKANALQVAALKHTRDNRIKSKPLILLEVVDAKACAIKELGMEVEEEGPISSLGQADSWGMEAQPMLRKGIAATLVLLRQTIRFFFHLRFMAAAVCELCDLCVSMSS